MEDLLIILIMIIFAALGYLLMNLIDHSLVYNMQNNFLKRDESDAILIFTDNNNEIESEYLKGKIKNKKIRVLNSMDEYKLIRSDILIAMSDNDLENMTICSDYKHYFPSIFTIAKCNDALYKEIFQNIGIDVVLPTKEFNQNTLEVVKRWNHD